MQALRGDRHVLRTPSRHGLPLLVRSGLDQGNGGKRSWACPKCAGRENWCLPQVCWHMVLRIAPCEPHPQPPEEPAAPAPLPEPGQGNSGADALAEPLYLLVHGARVLEDAMRAMGVKLAKITRALERRGIEC